MTAFLRRTGCCGERACPALGCEAAPIKQNAVYQIWPGWLVLGLLRSPTRGKPARHKVPARHNKPARHSTSAATEIGWIQGCCLRPAICFKYPTSNASSLSGNTLTANAGIFACGQRLRLCGSRI